MSILADILRTKLNICIRVVNSLYEVRAFKGSLSYFEREREREVKGIERLKARRVNLTLSLMLSPNYVSGSQADSY